MCLQRQKYILFIATMVASYSYTQISQNTAEAEFSGQPYIEERIMFYRQQLCFRRITDEKLWDENSSTAYHVNVRSITWYLVHVFALVFLVYDSREKHTSPFTLLTSCSHACAACTHSTQG